MRNIKRMIGSILGFALAATLPLAGFAQTLERVQDSGSITIGYVEDQAPFSSGTGDSASGYAIDLCLRSVDVAKDKLELSTISVKYSGYSNVEAGLRALSAGSVDLLCGAVTDTLKRREGVSFSIPIYNGGTGVVIRDDAAKDLKRVLEGKVAHEGPIWRSTINRGLANHTYVVLKGTTDREWVLEQVATLGVVADVVEVDSHAAGVEMVAAGKADAFFADRSVLAQLVNTGRGSGDLELLPRYFNFQALAIAVARGDEDMRLVVDTALSQLYRSDEFTGVFSKYFGDPGDFTTKLFKAYARP